MRPAQCSEESVGVRDGEERGGSVLLVLGSIAAVLLPSAP